MRSDFANAFLKVYARFLAISVLSSALTFCTIASGILVAAALVSGVDNETVALTLASATLLGALAAFHANTRRRVAMKLDEIGGTDDTISTAVECSPSNPFSAALGVAAQKALALSWTKYSAPVAVILAQLAVCGALVFLATNKSVVNSGVAAADSKTLKQDQKDVDYLVERVRALDAKNAARLKELQTMVNAKNYEEAFRVLREYAAQIMQNGGASRTAAASGELQQTVNQLGTALLQKIAAARGRVYEPRFPDFTPGPVPASSDRAAHHAKPFSTEPSGMTMRAKFWRSEYDSVVENYFKGY